MSGAPVRQKVCQGRQVLQRCGTHDALVPEPFQRLSPGITVRGDDLLVGGARAAALDQRRRLGERSIVRPVFSYYGKLVIDDSVIKNIVHIVAEKLDEVHRVGRTHIRHLVNGDEDLGITVSLEVVFAYGHAIAETMMRLRRELQMEIERMTGMVVHEVDILVKSLYVDKATAARA